MGTVKVADREFELGEPNALHLTRILTVVGSVGTRAERVAANMGKRLFERVSGKEGETTTDNQNLSSVIFPFLAALTPDDMLALMAALLQFDDEQKGIQWVRAHPPKLSEVVSAFTANMENAGGIVEAIQNFTQVFSLLRLPGTTTPSTPAETG